MSLNPTFYEIYDFMTILLISKNQQISHFFIGFVPQNPSKNIDKSQSIWKPRMRTLGSEEMTCNDLSVNETTTQSIQTDSN